MKPKIWVFLILIILTLATYGYFKSIPGVKNEAQSRAEIDISPSFFDFGEIEYGQVAEYTFLVKNLGEETLEIKKVATSCACTKAKISKENIKPGEITELLVTYDTGAMSGAHAKGEQERIIYVKSSDPINPQVEVMIYANVK